MRVGTSSPVTRHKHSPALRALNVLAGYLNVACAFKMRILTDVQGWSEFYAGKH